MAEPAESGEKSHEATPKKLQDARKKGQIPKSADLNASAAYLGLILALTILGPTTLLDAASKLSHLLSDPAAFIAIDGTTDSVTLAGLMKEVGISSLLPLFSIPAIAVLLSLLGQQAFTFAPSKIQPKLNKISPIASVKNKYGASGLFEFLKSALKLVVVSLLMLLFLRSTFPDMLHVISLEPSQISALLGLQILSFLTIIFGMSLIVGGIDYLWQVAEHHRKHRMTRKEVEDESKEAEGDPHNKQARRQRGYEIAMNQMLADVPEAAVVIVNPTHYAVALKWDANSPNAPVCVAKGVDEIAARIREVAHAASVPIHSDPPTARSLYAHIDVGKEIWPENFRAVAAAIRFAQSMNTSRRNTK